MKYLLIMLFLFCSVTCYSEDLFFCKKCYTGTLFWDYSNKENEGGVEVNRWIHWFDKYSTIHEMREKTENDFVRKWIMYGGGMRFRLNQTLDQFYLSVYPMIGFLPIVGVAAGPELGKKNDGFDYGGSIRFWFTVIGFDLIKTIHSSLKMRLYINVPLYVPWIDAYD